jgi:RNA polymerase sigma-70 factor (ECF subfamily)
LRKGVGSSADVDDIAQEVFLRLLRYDRSDLVSSPQAYLYKVASNISTEWATRSSRRLPHKSGWLTDLVDTLYPETAVERESAHAELKRAIAVLPPRCRDILRMHFDAGMSHETIAKRLLISRRMVRREMERAYAALRATLDPDLLRAMAPPSAFDRPL